MRFSLDPPFSFSFFSSLLFLSLLTLLAVPAAGTVLPSNTSADLSWTNNLRFRLSGHIHLPSNVTLAPLTEYLVNLSPRKIKVSSLHILLVQIYTDPLDLQCHGEPRRRQRFQLRQSREQ